jgi:cobalt-zinc-cadmium efflux system membrane fusion protein
MNRRKISWGLFALLGLSGCGKPEIETRGPPDAKVEGSQVIFPADAPQLASLTIEPAKRRRFAVTHLTGRLFLADDATVRIFTPVAGQVGKVRVDVGQTVEADAPLAEINSPDYGQALADARSADANLAAADKAFTRAKDLFDHGAAAAKDVEAAQAADGSATAERDRALGRLRLYHGSETGTDQVYILRSPLAGVVIEKNINPGQELRSDQMLANATNLFAPLFVISDPTRLWIQIDAAETDLANLAVGQRIQVVSPAFPGKAFTGAIANIGPSLDPATRAARVRGVVENPGGLLKAEMYVSVDVVQDEGHGDGAEVEISSKAIFTIDGKSYLFVEPSAGRFERRTVEIGAEKDGKVPVISGVVAGEKVVIEGGLLLEAELDPSS